MTPTSLSGQKIAIMVANGFAEDRFVAIQKMLLAANARLKVIAPGAGLVHGRNGNQAGMSYPVDSQLSETLAIDYDGLVIPSGEQHLAILRDELHGSRIIRAFMRESMPVLVQGSALELVAEIEQSIDAQTMMAEDDTAQEGKLLWISDDCSMAEAARKFVANCLAVAEDESSKSDSSAAA